MSVPQSITDDLDRRIGSVLIAAAVDVQSEQKRAMSKSYPPASRKGEYLHGRTWNAREGVVYEPTDPLTVGREGRVRVGYTAAAWYAGWWEVQGGRLGLVATVNRIKGRVNKWLAAARRIAAGGGG